MRDGVIIFAAGFGGDGVGDGMDQVGVPGGSEADGLRENSGVAGTRDAVESFIPPIVGGRLQARDGGNVLHLRDFFFDGHAGDKIGDALLDGERSVEIDGRKHGRLRRFVLGESEGREKREAEEQKFWDSHGC